MADNIKSPDQKVPVYFIGVTFPPQIGTLSYNVRGKSYTVPRNEEGAPDVGATLMADPNDVTELISKARYFNGKKNVEVFTTDATIAASVKKSFAMGKRTPIEARIAANDVVIAPTKEEILSMMTEDELLALLKKRGAKVPENLSQASVNASADESALERAKAVTANLVNEQVREMTPAEKRAAEKAAKKAQEAASEE